jgi:hypothetical protein
MADDDTDDLLEAIADVGATVARGFEAIGKGELAAKTHKGVVALRSAAEARRRLPEVLRAVGVTYENSAVARLERMLRKRGMKDRPSTINIPSEKSQ